MVSSARPLPPSTWFRPSRPLAELCGSPCQERPPALSVTARLSSSLAEAASLPGAAACREGGGAARRLPAAEGSGAAPAAMSTSLGSNTYNRQNWEDAVSPGGGRECVWCRGRPLGLGRDLPAVPPSGKALPPFPRPSLRAVQAGKGNGLPWAAPPRRVWGVWWLTGRGGLTAAVGLSGARREPAAAVRGAEASPGWAQCEQ